MFTRRFFMKKIIISSIFLLSLPLCAATYEELRAELKNKLYRVQKRVMTEQEYNAFIEPFLCEGEAKWQIPAHCREHPESPLIKKYFDCLCGYNIATFGKYVDRSAPYKKAIGEAKAQLTACIQEMKDTWDLKDFDVKAEVKRTTSLLRRATETYYNQLGLGYKALCLFEKVKRVF